MAGNMAEAYGTRSAESPVSAGLVVLSLTLDGECAAMPVGMIFGFSAARQGPGHMREPLVRSPLAPFRFAL
jgi:hypothetical protein